MMEIVSALVSPITFTMDFGLTVLFALTGSYGASVALLGTICSLCLLPLQRWASKIERRHTATARAVAIEVKELKATGLRGEALFEATERVYQKARYHPIHAICGSLSIVVSLPVLISGLLLLTNSPELRNVGFMFVEDLAMPDRSLFLLGTTVNVLPILMLAVSLLDARMRFVDDHGAFVRHFFISIVIVWLVYQMPAAVVIYWTSCNITGSVLWASLKFRQLRHAH